MNGKKLFGLVIILAVFIAIFTGCGEVSNNSLNTKNELTIGDLSIEVLACEFDNEVMGTDEEISNWGFAKIDGKVYVNLALKITNNGTEPVGEDDIKAYFEYDELRYDLQYELMSVAPVNSNNGDIAAGCVGTVYMLTRVEEAALNEDITVHYTINEKEYTQKIAPIDTRNVLEKKNKVSVGDKLDVEKLYSIEVLKCSVGKSLQTTNYDESEQYFYNGKKIVDLVLKIKNNTKVDLKDGINGYIIIGNEVSKGNIDVETDNNKKLEGLEYAPIKSNGEGIVHIYAAVEEDVSMSGLAMRFNIAGNCYYCTLKQ